MAECVLLKKENNNFIKVNDWSTSILFNINFYSGSSQYREVKILKDEITKRINNSISTIKNFGLGDYINYNTIFLEISFGSFKKIVPVSKDSDLREAIILNNNNNIISNFWLGISRRQDTNYGILIRPFVGKNNNIGSSYTITFKIIGVSNDSYIINDN